MDGKETRDLLSRISSLLEESQKTIEEYDKEIKSLVKENQELVESQKTWNLIEQNDNWFDFKEVAKLINIKGFGRNKILELLRMHQIFDSNNQPYQKNCTNGYFKITLKYVESLDTFVSVPLSSKKGIDFIVKIIEEAIHE